MPYFTAYRALVQRAEPRSGERVLIHGASGAVGIATVQLALAAGLMVVGTAGSEAGSELVAAQGDVRVVDHRDPSHMEAAVGLTGGRGFDIIIEFLANVNLGHDLKALALRGRVVVVGSRGTVEVDARDLMNAEGAVLGMRTPNARPEEVEAARAAVDAGLRERRTEARGRPRAPARGGRTGPPPDHGASGARPAGAGPVVAAAHAGAAPSRRRVVHPLDARQPGLAAAAAEPRRPSRRRRCPETRNGGWPKTSRSSAWVTRRGPPSPVSCSLKQRT